MPNRRRNRQGNLRKLTRRELLLTGAISGAALLGHSTDTPSTLHRVPRGAKVGSMMNEDQLRDQLSISRRESAIDHSHQPEKEQYTLERAWEGTRGPYRQLLRLINEEPETVYGAEALRQSVATAPKTITCIDERCALPQPRIGLAGAGVLMNPDDAIQSARQIQGHGLTIETVTYHEGCGACELARQEYCQHHPGAQIESIDMGYQSAKQMMELLGLQGEPVRCGYSREAQLKMRGAPEFHDARAIVLDGTGRFNPAVLGLPPSFHHSVCFEKPGYSANELGIAITIAKEEHGFGYGRLREEPLAVVLIGDPIDSNQSVDALSERFHHVLDVHQDIVQVIRLTAPDYRI